MKAQFEEARKLIERICTLMTVKRDVEGSKDTQERAEAETNLRQLCEKEGFAINPNNTLKIPDFHGNVEEMEIFGRMMQFMAHFLEGKKEEDIVQGLRIGNLLTVMRSSVQFKRILDNGSIWFTDGRGGYGNAQQGNYKPIPLTPEWLLKLGWKFYQGKTSGPLTKDCYPAMLDLDFIDGSIQMKSRYLPEQYYRKLPHIKHVHDLQNLYYSLTGKELTENKLGGSE